MRPAARCRATSVESKAATSPRSFVGRLPLDIGLPRYGANRSLRRNGTPRNGPSGRSPAAIFRASSNQR
jgi:hypothetical protein